MAKKIRAYVLINLAIGAGLDVINKLKEIPHVISIASTTGIFDVIVKIQVNEVEEFEEVITKRIHSIPGIVKTDTQVVINEIEAEA